MATATKKTSSGRSRSKQIVGPDGTTKRVLIGSKADTKYAAQGYKDYSGTSSSGSSSPGLTTPTVITSATINEETIPDLNNRANNLYGTPSPYPVPPATDPTKTKNPKAPTTSAVTGQKSLYDELTSSGILGEQTPINPIDKEYDDLYGGMFDLMGKEVDRQAQKQTNNAMALYGARRRDIKTAQEAAAAQKANLTGYLFNTGASRYGTAGGGGLVTSTEQQLLNQLSDLSLEENNLMDEIRDAQKEGNWRVMEKKLEFAEERRKEKRELQAKTIEAIQKRNEEMMKNTIQASRESAISDLYSQGITNPAQMLDYLNFDESGNQVGDVTLKEINDTLKALVPEGLNDIVKSAAEGGASAQEISKILQAPSINQAYQVATPYLQKNQAGAVGEYQFYVAQARKAGQVPMGFLEFKNYEGGGGGAGGVGGGLGLSKAGKDVIDYEFKFGDQFGQQESVKQFKITENAYSRLQGATGSSRSLDKIKALTDSDVSVIAQAVARMEKPDITRAADSGDALASSSITGRAEEIANQLIKDRSKNPSKVLERLQTADKLYAQAQKQVQPTINEYQTRIKELGLEGTVKLPTLVHSDINKIIYDQKAAKERVNEFVRANPSKAQIIADLYAKPSPAFDNKPPTELQILEYLQAKGWIQ